MGIRKRVAEIMVPIDQYPSVRDSTSLGEAVAVIEGSHLDVNRRKSLPRVLLVFDGIDVLVGYVRRRDLMRGIEPAYLVGKPLEHPKGTFQVDTDPNLAEFARENVVGSSRERAHHPVSDVMQPIEAILDADDHVVKAIQEMVALDVSLIPVLENRRVVGVVRSVDVFRELAGMLALPEAPAD